MSSIPVENSVYSGLVTVDELVAYMSDVNLNASQREEAARILAGTQQELENYLNRPLQPVQVREAVQSDLTGVGYLNVTPVHKIISVNVIEVSYGPDPLNMITPYVPPVMARDPLLDNNGRMIDWLTKPSFGDPLVVPGGVYIGYPSAFYAVEYIAGYNGYVDEGLKNAIKMVAARSVDKNHVDVVSLRGDQAEAAVEADSRPKGWTIDELAAWDRLRRRVAV